MTQRIPGILRRLMNYEEKLDHAVNNLEHFQNTCIKLTEELDIIRDNIDELRNFVAEITALLHFAKNEDLGTPNNPIVIDDLDEN